MAVLYIMLFSVLMVTLLTLSAAWGGEPWNKTRYLNNLNKLQKGTVLPAEKCFKHRYRCNMPKFGPETLFCYYRCRCAGYRSSHCIPSKRCPAYMPYQCVCIGPRTNVASLDQRCRKQ